MGNKLNSEIMGAIFFVAIVAALIIAVFAS
jgi:hypothetical protein